MEIRTLEESDRSAWESLWKGYQAFYSMDIKLETTAVTWERFQNPKEPIHALGAFTEGVLVGIVHYVYHLSSSTTGPYCYLQDLFTSPDHRRQGIGEALIEAVYERASEDGASRVYWLTHETNATAIRLYEKLAQRSGFIQYRKLFA